MALSFDAQGNGSDDFSHDTLMGLSELDSIFEDTTAIHRNTLAAESMPDSQADTFFDINEDNIGYHPESELGSISYTKIDKPIPEIAIDNSHLQAYGIKTYVHFPKVSHSLYSSSHSFLNYECRSPNRCFQTIESSTSATEWCYKDQR